MVYANEPARESFAKSGQSFSPGAIIVREKLSQADDKTAELLAVMLKREKGFNRAANDWEFLVVNGAGTKVKHREKNGDCVACHKSAQNDDFVFKQLEIKPLPAN